MTAVNGRQLIDPEVNNAVDTYFIEKESDDELQIQEIKIEECDSDVLPELEDSEMQRCPEMVPRNTSDSVEEFSQETTPKQTQIDNVQSFEIGEISEENSEEFWQIQSPGPCDNVEDSLHLHSDTLRSEDQFELTCRERVSEENPVSILPVPYIKQEGTEDCSHRESSGATQISSDHGDLQYEVMENASYDDKHLSLEDPSYENYGVSCPMIKVKQELRDSD